MWGMEKKEDDSKERNRKKRKKKDVAHVPNVEMAHLRESTKSEASVGPTP